MASVSLSHTQTHQPVLTLTQRTTFPALTTKLVKAKFNGKADFSLPHIATIFCKQTNALLGGPALIHITEEGLCTIAVTNCATHDIELDRASLIANIETDFDCTKATPLSQQHVNSVFETINSVTSQESLHSFTKEQIEQKANINVPPEYRAQYIDLLYKHRTALSMSNRDLGRAKSFFHRVLVNVRIKVQFSEILYNSQTMARFLGYTKNGRIVHRSRPANNTQFEPIIN